MVTQDSGPVERNWLNMENMIFLEIQQLLPLLVERIIVEDNAVRVGSVIHAADDDVQACTCCPVLRPR